MTCPSCGAEAVEQAEEDPLTAVVWLRTTCPQCGRQLLLRQKHPQANPRWPRDDGEEE